MIKKIIEKIVRKELLKEHINTRSELLAVIDVMYRNNLVTGEKFGKLVETYKADLNKIVKGSLKENEYGND